MSVVEGKVTANSVSLGDKWVSLKAAPTVAAEANVYFKNDNVCRLADTVLQNYLAVKVIDDTMFVKLHVEQDGLTNAAAGTGTVVLTLPAGYEVASFLKNGAHVGHAQIGDNATDVPGLVRVASRTTLDFVFYTLTEGTPNLFNPTLLAGGATVDFESNDFNVIASAVVPIKRV